MSEKDANFIKYTAGFNVLAAALIVFEGKDPSLQIVLLLALIAYAITRTKPND